MTLVKFFLEKGAKPNDQNELGSAAMHYAIEHHNLEMLKLLHEHGADLHLSTLIPHLAQHKINPIY